MTLNFISQDQISPVYSRIFKPTAFLTILLYIIYINLTCHEQNSWSYLTCSTHSFLYLNCWQFYSSSSAQLQLCKPKILIPLSLWSHTKSVKKSCWLHHQNISKMSAIAFLGTYPIEMEIYIHTKTYRSMFTAALFRIAIRCEGVNNL